MSLALRLGYRNVDQMLRELDSRQISEWFAYFKLEQEAHEDAAKTAELRREALRELRSMSK